MRTTLLIGVGVGALALTACATLNPTRPSASINGTWESYGSFGGAIASNGPSAVPAPGPVPEPPLKTEYLAAWKARQKATADATARGEPVATGYVDCIPDGMPAMMMAMFPIEFLESNGQVTIVEEAYNQVRRIYLDEQQIPVNDAEPYFWGHSVGHWEGDVLVADTVGIKENVRFRDVPHSDQMRISERISLIDHEYMQDQVTVTDPVYLTAPWTWTWKYKRTPGYKIQEYVCEANREYRDPVTGAQRIRTP